jgi:hypothetical protein
MGAGYHVEPQKLAEPHGVNLVILELGVADDAHLEGMGKDHFLNAGDRG